MSIHRTIVVNLHKSSYTKYIGRGSKFGNPYRIGVHGTRDDVIRRFYKYFYANSNEKLREAVWEELKGDILGCFCKPARCHGDIYVGYIRNRMRSNDETEKD